MDKEEKLDVRTSTMTIGIRGTVIYLDTGSRTGENASAGESASPTPAADNSSTAVSSDTGSKASEETTLLGVLEGTVEVIYVDVNGKEYECKLFTWDSRSEKEKTRQQENSDLCCQRTQNR